MTFQGRCKTKYIKVQYVFLEIIQLLSNKFVALFVLLQIFEHFELNRTFCI